MYLIQCRVALVLTPRTWASGSAPAPRARVLLVVSGSGTTKETLIKAGLTPRQNKKKFMQLHWALFPLSPFVSAHIVSPPPERKRSFRVTGLAERKRLRNTEIRRIAYWNIRSATNALLA